MVDYVISTSEFAVCVWPHVYTRMSCIDLHGVTSALWYIRHTKDPAAAKRQQSYYHLFIQIGRRQPQPGILVISIFSLSGFLLFAPLRSVGFVAVTVGVHDGSSLSLCDHGNQKM